MIGQQNGGVVRRSRNQIDGDYAMEASSQRGQHDSGRNRQGEVPVMLIGMATGRAAATERTPKVGLHRLVPPRPAVLYVLPRNTGRCAAAQVENLAVGWYLPAT